MLHETMCLNCNFICHIQMALYVSPTLATIEHLAISELQYPVIDFAYFVLRILISKFLGTLCDKWVVSLSSID